MTKLPIIVIVGPTAVGKTSLSIALAKQFNGEIISGDSMQIYKKLNIGTAKASLTEQAGIPHYLIDEVEVSESYTVSDFQKRGRQLIQDISAKGKTPIIVGGTGLYIESLQYDISLGGSGENDLIFRAQKEMEATEYGSHYLWEELRQLDPAAAEKIHVNNVRRVIRALEVHHVTGQLFSSYQNEREMKEPLYNMKVIGLTTERNILYDRINERVHLMIEQGLESEARWLAEQQLQNAQAARGIGYKEWQPYFEGRSSLDEVIAAIQQNSRRYAKRQLTWFRNRLPDISWWDLVKQPESKKELVEEVQQFLQDQ
ncbi:tRNA (adenosine(37)-N6)-dimethylallyltransferase MiaA [Carnobacterium mobile]|uniref:tRNA (adenosine(37)-N6)-dimethylallyltransferase MiaA n=1 Tax=Carnobacterium mobile TaxID=2750 RepID=UPI00186891DE|nr:tRNA (adenosine(37)-N6)-dimethylallyltransferase MiaA [Carnobacterium mobile]